MLPTPFESAFSLILWALLCYIVIVGILQLVFTRNGKRRENSFVNRPLYLVGSIAAVLGAIGHFNSYTQIMTLIGEVEDVSTFLVAPAFANSAAYLVLGLLGLAVSLLFGYINYRP